MKRRAPLTPEEIQGILRDHAAGVERTTICETYGICESTIWNHVKAAKSVALDGGQWIINRRTRVLDYVLDCDIAS